MGEEQAKTRIVVTGIGVIASLGTGVDSFWDSLVSGKSGISGVTRFDATDYTTKVAS